MIDKRLVIDWENNDTVAVAIGTVAKGFRMYWGRRNKEEALREIEKVMKFNNIVDEDYHALLADFYYEIGDLEKARTASSKVNSLWWTMLLEARAHHAKKEWDQAISQYDRVIEKFPWTQPYCGFLAAECCVVIGDLDKAIEEVQGAQGYFDGRHWLVYAKGIHLLGKIYEKKGERKLAIENYEQFLNLWKNADEDLPDLLDAKRRLAKLKAIAEK